MLFLRFLAYAFRQPLSTPTPTTPSISALRPTPLEPIHWGAGWPGLEHFVSFKRAFRARQQKAVHKLHVGFCVGMSLPLLPASRFPSPWNHIPPTLPSNNQPTHPPTHPPLAKWICVGVYSIWFFNRPSSHLNCYAWPGPRTVCTGLVGSALGTKDPSPDFIV